MNPSEELVLRAFNQAPAIIQESLSDGKAVDFMESMLTRYHLHIDTVGYVMEFIRNMLLGLLKPDEFIGKLNSVGISAELARRITADLNAEVFVPLRDEMKKGGAMTRPATIPQVPVMKVAKPAPVPPPLAPTPTPVPTPSIAPAFNLVHDVPAGPMPAAAPVMSQPAPRSAAEPVPPTPMVRTMQHDIDLLQHGVQASAYPAPSPTSGLHPSQLTPAQSFQTASVPVTSVPMPSSPTPPAPPQITPMPSRPVQHLAPQPSIPPTSNPSSDPYREPV